MERKIYSPFSVNHGFLQLTWDCLVAHRVEQENRVPAKLRSQGAPSLKPLRSAECPLGLPQLAGVDKAKVESANILYALAIEILVFLKGRNVIISIENPGNSYLWPALVALALQMSMEAAQLLNKLERASFHACCLGSTRRKNTAWVSTGGIYGALNAVCDYSHPHGEWSVRWTSEGWRFDTSSEAAYPTVLAQRATACLVEAARARGIQLESQIWLHDKSTAVPGKQSKRHQPLIPEFHHFGKLPPGSPCPPNAKIIAPHRGGEVREELSNFDQDDTMGISSTTVEKSEDMQQKAGFFHSPPKQFLSMAKPVQHPMDSLDHVEGPTRYGLEFNLVRLLII